MRHTSCAGHGLWKALLVGLVVLALAEVSGKNYLVEAFQSNSFGGARPRLHGTGREKYVATSTNTRIPFTTTSSHHHHTAKHKAFLQARLSMSTDSTTDESTTNDQNTRKSKRKRFKASVKKLVSYPKMKLQKLRSKYGAVSEESNDESDKINGGSNVNGKDTVHSEAFAVNGSSTTSPAELNGNENGNAVVEESTQTTISAAEASVVNGASLNIGQATLSTSTTVADDEKNKAKPSAAPSSGRSATSENADLSGKWALVVSPDFKLQYDSYLSLLGQPPIVRSVALSIIGMTSEETLQSDHGKILTIRGRNIRGNWERTLKASPENKPIIVPIVTADQETVQAECWWEGNGTIHRSWLRGVSKYGGGSFESKRFLEDDGNTLVCESTFFPSDPSRKEASVTWRFRRVD